MNGRIYNYLVTYSWLNTAWVKVSIDSSSTLRLRNYGYYENYMLLIEENDCIIFKYSTLYNDCLLFVTRQGSLSNAFSTFKVVEVEGSRIHPHCALPREVETKQCIEFIFLITL